jgi:glucosamine-6-phosphate deaminase
VIAATGASQFEFLDALTATKSVDWSRVEMFHLDEYVGIRETHPASFRRYLRERIVERVHPAAFHFLAGDAPTSAAECRRVGALLERAPVDVAFVGIGENGTWPSTTRRPTSRPRKPYLVVELDEACRAAARRGWFASLDDVPRRAISMSVRQILKAREILCIVPDAARPRPSATAWTGPVSPAHPSSILQTHPRTTLYLDRDSACALEARGGGVREGVRLARRLAWAAASRPWRGRSSGRAAQPTPRNDIPFTAEVRTPHVPWATKLPGGPIRGFFVPSILRGRDMVELMQRLALEPTDRLDRPRMGRQLLGNRRLLRRRPRAARGSRRLPDRLRLRRGGAAEHEAVRGARDPGPERLVALHAQDARRDPAPGERGAGLVLLHPFVGDVKGHPFLGDEAEGDTRIWEVSPLVNVPDDGVNERGLPHPNRDAITEGEWVARPHPITEGLDLGPRPVRRARRALLPLRSAGRRGRRGRRAAGRRHAHVRARPRRAFATVGDGFIPKAVDPVKTADVLGLLGVRILPLRARRLWAAREREIWHPQTRGVG